MDASHEPAVQHSSRIELSLSALRQNLNFARELIGSQTTISLVVKANAYGHGYSCMVEMAERCGIRHFCVASSQEAEEVHAAIREESRVAIMGILYDQDLPWIISHETEFFVFDLERLQRAVDISKEVGKPAKIHLEFETGGNRTGMDPADLPAALKLFTRNRKQLELTGVCTHLAGAESLSNTFRITQQLNLFKQIRQRISKAGSLKPMYHVASSAATIALPESRMDMVRVGSLAYGLWPSPDVRNLYLLKHGTTGSNQLKRVFNWKTDIMQIKNVKRGEFVGYGTSYQTHRDSRIAVLPIGYGNGLPRELSNRGHVLIQGRRAPVVGSINMNMFFADITTIPEARVGDEAVLVGRQKKNEISLRSFTEFSSSLNTEFVCRLPARIPRSIVR